MLTLKRFQQKAIAKLMSRTGEAFESNKSSFTIVFQSPTGSGKTFMMTKYIEELINKNRDKSLSFLWVSIGKGNLHEQSYRSVKSRISKDIECFLIEEEFFGSRSYIDDKEIVFINWEKIRSKDTVTGEWKNSLMKDKETFNFINVLENTRNRNSKIILIIDESHSGASTQRARELRDAVVCPYLTIEMSATPVLLEGDYDEKIKVDPTDVINEGLIKKEILINENISTIQDDEISSQELVMECAYRKRLEIKQKYLDLGDDINPLVIIQLPNAEYGDEKRTFIESFLLEKEISVKNRKLAIWTSNEKENCGSEITELNSEVEYLIFKQAIDTGWDCPRAQILVRFRETQSIVFEIQTLGRILRMPKGKHYSDDLLNRGYVYTNLRSINVKNEDYNPNIIKSLCSYRTNDYTQLLLKSIYRHRVDYGSLNSAFYETFKNTFVKFFNIEANDSNEIIKKKMEKSGIDFSIDRRLDEIIENASIETITIDKEREINSTDNVFLANFSDLDLQHAFESIIIDNLNGFVVKRSLPTAKEAVFYAFKVLLGINPFLNKNSVVIQSIIVKNKNAFSKILDSATIAFKVVHEEQVRKKATLKVNETWEIESSKNYSPVTHLEVKSKKSIYQPFFMPINQNGKLNNLELDFISYLDSATEVDWFWQNGQEHMETNFGIIVDDKKTFQPDFIVKFSNKYIGIFDTKGIGRDEEDNYVKSNALQKYIAQEVEKGKRIFGGLIVKSGAHFRIFLENEYVPFKKAEEEWSYLDLIIQEKMK